MPQQKIIFVADLHIDIEQTRRFAVLIQFLEIMLKKNYTIYLMGDLFNFWTGNSQGNLGTVRPFLRHLRKLAHTKRLLFMAGNRDFLFVPFFKKRLGGEIIEDGLEMQLGDSKILLYHGDSLCTGDIHYQQMKKWLQSQLVYNLSRLLPSSAGLIVGNKFRNTSKKAIDKKNAKEMGLNDEYMAKIIADNDVDGIICGHIHQPQIKTLSVGGRDKKVYVLPECKENTISYILWDSKELTYQDWTQ